MVDIEITNQCKRIRLTGAEPTAGRRDAPI